MLAYMLACGSLDMATWTGARGQASKQEREKRKERTRTDERAKGERLDGRDGRRAYSTEGRSEGHRRAI